MTPRKYKAAWDRVPEQTRRVHRASLEVLGHAETMTDKGSSNPYWWNLVLDLRDMISDMEGRYPVLGFNRPQKKR